MISLLRRPRPTNLFGAFSSIGARRLVFAGLVAATIAALLTLMTVALSRGGVSAVEVLLLVCFAITLPWTVIGFWNALIGLILMRTSRDPAKAVCPPLGLVDGSEPITASTAMLVCIRNEDVTNVQRNVTAMMDGLIRAGVGDRFHVYLLSDTNDPAIAAEEEAVYETLKRTFGDRIGIDYRRRATNPGYKAGNIRDFCDRWGDRHEFALTLDADSYMSTDAILRLVRVMQAEPKLGILQSLVTGLPATSAFARIFQFGMRHGMRSYTIGSAWWQGDCGPYWGHNALIRLKPFMESCHLPVLAGNSPLSGYILSHDQVEAVLMRRAGFEVRVIADDTGSWEENPATILEFIRRDLRWCQGNMQYFQLLHWPGLKTVSRAQLALAILMFLGAPAWITFMVTISLMFAFSADPGALIWPGAGSAVFFVVMTMVFAPKLASLADTMLETDRRRAYGGWFRLSLSAFMELIFSALLAPIMAVVQTLFLAGLPFGRKIGWPSQQRNSHAVAVTDAAKRLWVPTLFGLISFAWFYDGGSWAMLIALPVFLGPLIAVPIAVATAWKPFGDGLIAAGLVPVPEENTLPPALMPLRLEPLEPKWLPISDRALQPASQSINS